MKSNFKIPKKYDASMNCKFDVTTLVAQSLKVRSWKGVGKIFEKLSRISVGRKISRKRATKDRK